MPSMPSLGEMGGGLPGGAGGLTGGSGGLTGLGSQLADAIGGLLGSPDEGLPEPPESDEEVIDEVEPADDEKSVPDEDEDTDEDEADPKTDELAETDGSEEDPIEGCAQEEPVKEEPSPEPTPTPPPAPMPPPPAPITEPPPNVEPLGAETPCEIAADALPQAGPEN